MRGKRLFKRCRCSSLWITPAGAGKTISRLHLLSFLQDHPRRCGENGAGKSHLCTAVGSPPQVRGKRKHGFSQHTASRITPAGAGKTCQRCRGIQSRKDHPRRCGENLRLFCGQFVRKGSPPQVRGKQPVGDNPTMPPGITPAGAGKTNVAFLQYFLQQDHPRRCGENFTKSSRRRTCAGSPPQVRGKQGWYVHLMRNGRITPAGAGKTWDSVEVYGEL